MFGYVTPCKMELKIKDYERFKAYYCGLCKSIKEVSGNLPRLSLNYDMTFLAILLDAISDEKCTYKKQHCIVHPLKKKIVVVRNASLDYAAFCNVTLAYFKFVDNVKDDNSIASRFNSLLLSKYIKRSFMNMENSIHYFETKLKELYDLERNPSVASIDELSHPFAELTAYIISLYAKDASIKDSLYWLGYHLGKWIYVIDALDDLEKDMNSRKFNAINKVFNKEGLSYIDFSSLIKPRIDFILTASGAQCLRHLESLPIIKNKDLLYNILQFGLIEKMDRVFKRSESKNEKSL